jgi:hypothetical protein
MRLGMLLSKPGRLRTLNLNPFQPLLNGCLSSRSGGELREACRVLSGAEHPADLGGVVRPADIDGERPGIALLIAFAEPYISIVSCFCG